MTLASDYQTPIESWRGAQQAVLCVAHWHLIYGPKEGDSR